MSIFRDKPKVKRKTIKYRAIVLGKTKKDPYKWKGVWRNFPGEAEMDALRCPGAVVQRVEMGNPTKMTILDL